MVDHGQAFTQRLRGVSRRLSFGQVLYGAWVGFLIGVAAYSMWRLVPQEELTMLFGGRRLSAADLRRVEVAFARQNLNDYQIDEGRVQVPSSQRVAYLSALETNQGLPQSLGGVAAESLASGGVFETPSARRDRLEQAREQQLSAMIKAMPGVVDVNVIFDELVESGFPARRRQTATVGIVCEEDWELTLSQMQAISEAVCGARAGLTPDQVIIADLNLGRTARGGNLTASTPASPLEQLRYTERLESLWQKKLLSVLDFIPGVKVAVTVAGPAATASTTSAMLASTEGLAVTISIPKAHIDREYLRQSLNRDPNGQPAAELRQLVQQEQEQTVRAAVAGLFPTGAKPAEVHVLTLAGSADPQLWNINTAWVQLQSPAFWQRYGIAVGAVGLLAATLVGHSWRTRAAQAPPSLTAEPTLSIYRDDLAQSDGPGGLHDNAEDEESREELVRLVRHDPGRAAKVLTEWIREAG